MATELGKLAPSAVALRALEFRGDRKLRISVRIHRWFASRWRVFRIYPIAAGVALGIGLGWAGLNGFVRLDHLPWSSHLFYTLLLFKFSVPAVPRPNTELEIAMWIAPLTTLYAAFRAAATLYYEQWARFRIRRLTRGHVVVLGLGRVGSRLAIGFAERGVPVLAIDHSLATAAGKLQICREHGIAFVAGDASDPDVLSQAGLDRASMLIVVCGSDALNAQSTLAALPLAGTGRGRLRCYVHIDEERLCAMLEQAALGDASQKSVELEFFNVFRAGPRALLDEYGIGLPEDSGARHVVVVGGGTVASNVFLEVARRRAIDPDWHDPLRLTLVTPSAGTIVKSLEARYPELSDTCTIVSCEADASDPLAGAELAIEIGEGEETIVLVCEEDDSAGVRSTLQLRQLIDPRVLIVLCSSSSTDSGALLRLAGADALPNAEGFALLDRVASPEVLLNGERELVAQTIHSSYVRAERRRGGTTRPGRPADDPALRRWEELPESLRESNRAQASDIGHKLQLVGRRIIASTSWRPPADTFSGDEIEQLAKLEHDRWTKERVSAGWVYGPLRDPVKRTTPSLVDWEQLDDDDKDRDREAVRGIPLFLARTGFAVARSERLSNPTAGGVQSSETTRDLNDRS